MYHLVNAPGSARTGNRRLHRSKQVTRTLQEVTCHGPTSCSARHTSVVPKHGLFSRRPEQMQRHILQQNDRLAIHNLTALNHPQCLVDR